MTKTTSSWMPLWIGDYLADTQHLTRDEHGAYLLLLMTYWRNGGPLADDDRRLAAIVKASSKEWRALRPVLAEFFTVAGGVWRQKRVEAELSGSIERAEKAVSKAKKGAEARWKQSQEDAPSNAPSNAPSSPPSSPPSNAQAMPRQCPSPSPINTFTKEERLSLSPRGVCSELDLPPATDYGRICLAMKAAGLADTSPGNPEFRVLVDAGADAAEFLAAAQEAVSRGKGFRYAVSCVATARKRALELAGQIHRGELPATETAYQRSMRERVREFAPSVARKAPHERSSAPQNTAEFFTTLGAQSRTVGALK